MKKLSVLGFAVVLLLVACAAPSPEVAVGRTQGKHVVTVFNSPT